VAYPSCRMVLWSMDTIVFSYANADNASLVNHLILLLHKSDVREQRARQAPSCGWCLASLATTTMAHGNSIRSGNSARRWGQWDHI
jgi:hypothetical protein